MSKRRQESTISISNHLPKNPRSIQLASLRQVGIARRILRSIDQSQLQFFPVQRVLHVQFLFYFSDRTLLQLLTVLDPSFGVGDVLVQAQVLQPIADVLGVPFCKWFVWPVKLSTDYN